VKDPADTTPPPGDPAPTVTFGQMETLPPGAREEPPYPLVPMPESIGGYRIVGRLGEGGMGVVWEADQQSPRRRVAVKVMRQAQLFDPLHARMFEREVEMLGRLKHPGIAAIYESGRTGDGHNFFAMELVRGETLDQWMKKRSAAVTHDEVRLRLRIFRSIGDAVNYAHQRGVIHRDLKPSNIIVTNETSSASGVSGPAPPAIKILDFGLARLADPAPDATGDLTLAGVIRGTPQYMSPEQARGEAGAIDLRTDVYSLGVILYELLTGRRPYDLTGVPLSRAASVIAAAPPAPLRDARKGSGRLDPDLETIVLKALEKEPDRRYASAADLSEDVERYLTAQPIVARAPSGAYRARKFLQRHRIGASIAALLLLVLIVFAATMTVQAERIARERDRANREAEAFRRVADFMAGMFRVSDPSEARGNSVTAREILDKASKEIETGLADDPELRARLLLTMGTVYRGLALYPKAQSLLDESVDTYRRALGPEDPETLKAMAEGAIVLAQQGRYAEAEKAARQVLEVRRRVLGPDDPEIARTLSNVAVDAWYQGHLAEAETLLIEALDLSRRVRGPEHPDTLGPKNNLGLVYMDEGKYPEAEKIFRETLETRRRISGPDHPDTLKALLNLALVCVHEGHMSEAESLYKDGLDLRRRVFGPDHHDTLESMSSLAVAYYQDNRFPEAEKLQREALESRRRVLGPDHPDTLLSMNSLANVYDSEGRHAEAEALYRETLERRRRVLGDESPDTLLTTIDLAEACRGEGRYDESERLLKRTLEIQRRAPASDQTEVGLSLYGLGCTAAGKGEKERALGYLREALDSDLRPDVARKMEKDPELELLHGDARFASLVAEAKKIAAPGE
jgi:non-specific serine/threonine protein kinase/serine/threonine-protein kinase